MTTKPRVKDFASLQQLSEGVSHNIEEKESQLCFRATQELLGPLSSKILLPFLSSPDNLLQRCFYDFFKIVLIILRWGTNMLNLV